MKKSFKVVPLIIFVFLAASVFSCGDPIPLKEMSLAKLEITKALSVKADKYAPAELEAAKKNLFESHTNVQNDNLDKAKDSAIVSLNKAKEAYEKSLPLLARDTMDVAEKSLADADEANAPVLAKDEFAQAQAGMKKSGELFENKKYYECYENSVETDKQAKNARNIALGKQNILRDAVEEVKVTLSEAKRYNAAEYAPDKVKSAEDNNKIAADSLASLQLKKGFGAVEVAKLNADEALLAGLRGSAQEELASVEVLIDKAEKSPGAATAKDELLGAKEQLSSAKTSFADSKYKESLAACAEARRLASTVLDSKKGADVAAIDTKDTKDKSSGADKIKDVKKTVISEEPGDYYIYKVKYVPERRDCLWRIAGKYYRNPRIWKIIYEVNKDKIKNPHLIWPGMTIRVPKDKSGAAKFKDENVKSDEIESIIKNENEPVKENKADAEMNKGSETLPPEKMNEGAPSEEKAK